MDKIDEKIALGTKVFSRTDDLQRLLDSIPSYITKVYVADDGKMTQKKSALYDADYSFELEVIDLEYDAGVGAGRNALVEAVTEDYIFIVDPDHQLTPTMNVLYEQLQELPEMGGIGAIIAEPENDRVYSQAADFREENTEEGVKLIREAQGVEGKKEVRVVSGAPLAEFDFIPHATLFRSDCLQEQAWDDTYQTEYEHSDFFVAHWKHTDWKFAISPSVHVLHYPGGSTEYLLHRQDPDKTSHGREYFMEKWGYIDMETTEERWIEAGSIATVSKNIESAFRILREEGPIALLRQARLYLSNDR
jgi:hypothetical protein